MIQIGIHGHHVAPFMGAWIEILTSMTMAAEGREVAPFMGAWIEITTYATAANRAGSRTLHGCVD